MSASNYFKEIPGILGGIGPEATNYFVSLLVSLRQKEAQTDQDHIPFLLFNNPQIPDRTDYLLGGSHSPIPELIHTGNVLKKAGATFLAMPCNTAYAFTQELEQEIGLEIINMIALTAQYVVNKYGQNATVGLLATDGTLKSMLYQKEFSKASSQLAILVPDTQSQKDVMKGIYTIKSSSITSDNSKLLYSAAEKLINQGADVIIMGCTEIPIALKQTACPFPLIDPMELLAKEVINKVYSEIIEPDR